MGLHALVAAGSVMWTEEEAEDPGKDEGEVGEPG